MRRNSIKIQNELEQDLVRLEIDVPPEMLDFLQVMIMGAKKHGANNWLDADGKKSSHKDMHASMFRHLAASSAGVRTDEESGMDHLLHLMTRAGMYYTRLKRGLIHSADN